MAYQLAEQCFEENHIVIVGIVPKGVVFAKLLAQDLKNILPDLNIKIETLKINKENPLSEPIQLSCQATDLNQKFVVLADDVINSGKTAFYAMQPFMQIPLKKLKTAVLLDRRHKDFPVASDFVGLSLNTTLREHITVDITPEEMESAYLV